MKKNVIFLLLLPLLWVSCKDDDTEINNAVYSINLEKSDTLVSIGSEIVLNPVYEGDNIQKYNFEWISDNTSIATVSEGKVTAIKTGKAKITLQCKDLNLSASCIVNVGVEYDNLIFYMKDVEGITQIYSKEIETNFIKQLTSSSESNTELNIVSESIIYIRNKIEYHQKIGVYNEYTVHPINKIACWGDSMTEGAGGNGINYPKVLNELTGLDVSNNGVGGQTSTEVVARQGAIPYTITLENNEIPVSGSVEITNMSNKLLIYPGIFWGTLNNVYGKLALEKTGIWTFSRFEQGESIFCPANSIFKIDNGEKDNHISIFWYGRNNYNDGETVIRDIQSSISHLKPLSKKFIILSICNSDRSYEKKGMDGYNKIIELNNKIKDLYPDNYIDIRKILVEKYDIANETDLQNYVDDVPPSSLRSDALHLNAKGYTIVGEAVYDKMKELGWVK